MSDGLVKAPADPIRGRATERASAAEMLALIDRVVGGVPALADCPRALLDLILPSEDLAASMRFLPGPGLVAGLVGQWINRKLDFPVDGKPWLVGYRADRYLERDGDGTLHEFVHWQLLPELGLPPRARRREAVHLVSLLPDESGPGGRLAVSRRRLAISDPRELPDKWHDRYALATRRVDDPAGEPQLLRFLERSDRLRALLGSTHATRLHVVRTDMERPFQQPLLREVGALSHNYYLLNEETGDRMFIHWFDFFHGAPPRLVDRLGRLLLPHELGHYEVSDFRAAERTATFDAQLGTGLTDETGSTS